MQQELCFFRSPNNVYHSAFYKETLQIFAGLTKSLRLPLKGERETRGNGLKMYLAAKEVCVVVKPKSTTIRLVKIPVLPLCQLWDTE